MPPSLGPRMIGPRLVGPGIGGPHSGVMGNNVQQNVVIIMNDREAPDTRILSKIIQLDDKQFVATAAALFFLKEFSIDVPPESSVKQIYRQAVNYAKNNGKEDEWQKIREEAKKELTEEKVKELRIRIQTVLDLTHPKK